MKIDEIREKSIQELNEMIVDYKKQLFDLRFKKFTNKYENSTDLGRANSQMKDIRKIEKSETLEAVRERERERAIF